MSQLSRTSSALPNLDEQKREQARYDSLRVAPVLPTQSIPKQHVPTNKSVTADQSSSVDGHSVSKSRRNVQVTAGPYNIETQKPAVHPVNGMPMQMPFQPGGNFGVLKNPCAQPVMYSGVISGPVQCMNEQHGMQRTNSDAKRWQQTNSFQKGLIPSPQTPAQVMQKAERKYEVGKVTDEEQAKQRQLKGILNKLTPQNFERLFEKVKQVNIDNAGTLTGVVSQIFDKALMKPKFCEMYSTLCYYLAGELPDFSEDNEKITFKRLLLNKCQEEFERGEREQEEANRADGEGETKKSDEEREDKKIQARRRMLGNIRLIGELYKKKMFTERIMHECIKKLLGQYQNPDEKDIEALCKLMSTIGEMIDHPKAKVHMDAYFDMMDKISNNMKLSSRVRFMLKDSIDLRKNRWQRRRKVGGPRKIEELHRDAANERQALFDSLRAAPVLPTQSIPKQHVPTNNSVTADQSSSVNGHSVSKARRNVQVTAGPHTIETQKPVHHVNGMPMQMPFQPGGNFGVLKNPCAQPVMYSGVISGPVQYINQQYGMQRTNSDAERWQQTNSFQRGLIPSPRTPAQVMQKAERKYEVGKVTNEEQAKQRQLKGILNKLTPQNFERLFEKVKQVNIDNAGTLTGVVSQIFDKALMKPKFCEMYATLCYYLAGELPDFSVDNEKITFRRLLLNKCQEEFERGEREQEEADGEGETKKSDEEREDKKIQARRRMLGNIRLIGELYKKKMFTERIMHECIKKLLGQYQNPDEKDIEALCKLMSTIGELIDHPKAKAHMDAYFDMMAKLSNNMKLSSRVWFMLKDSIDLRKNRWQQRRKVGGPRKIEEMHRDTANERQARHDSLRAEPVLPTQSIPKQHVPTNKSVTADQSSDVDGHSVSKARRNVQVTAGPHTIETQKPAVHSINGMPMQMPFQPGGDFGVLKNPCAQPVMYSGVISGPVQYINQQYGMQRTNFDSERWQQTNSFQMGLIPSPRTPALVMHKAERKYEVGKVTDEEQAKQRQLKGILNKLTPQNFRRLFEKVKQVNIVNAGTLTGVVSQIFDKALMNSTFCEMYATLCYYLAGELPDFNEDNENISFKRLLLNKCQMEFERGEREQEKANRADGEGETKQSDEDREEKRIQARRQKLGNIRLIGELYKKKMLTERIMHECIKKLLGQYQNPEEEDIEALCKLMSTIGEMIDHPKAKVHMDAYFDMMAKLSNNMKLSSRVRFMLKDSIDLRKNRWQRRRMVEGPKKIEEVDRDAVNEGKALNILCISIFLCAFLYYLILYHVFRL